MLKQQALQESLIHVQPKNKKNAIMAQICAPVLSNPQLTTHS